MDKPYSIMVIGAGRMGEILARSMSWKHRVTIYTRNTERGKRLAEETGCQFAEPASVLPGAEVVVLALPSEETVPVLQSICPFLETGTVVVNVATNVFNDVLRPVLKGTVHLVGVKIVGQYREMHERPVIVIDADSERGKQVAAALFTDIGQVQPGDEKQVQLINSVATNEAFRAAVRIENRLREAGVHPDLIGSALRSAAAGSIKSYASGDIGPFGMELLKKIRKELDPR